MMKGAVIFTSIFVAVAFVPASATIINVPADYPTIQEGINASSDGDTVLVQPGTYVENINFNGHNIVLGSLFLTTGDTSYISLTIIDGDSSGTVVTFENSEDSTAVITGFTIQNGYGRTGGGIYCINSDPVISNNIIIKNLAFGNFEDGSGGGTYCSNSNSIIMQNIISENVAKQISDDDNPAVSYGGGIACDNCSQILILGNMINLNLVDAYNGSTCRGGGIFFKESNPTIIDNTISQNNAGGIIGFGFGGGISFEDSNPIIRNNLIEGNTSTRYGGGINCVGFTEATIENNIILDNSASDLYGVGGGIHCIGVNANINKSIIKGNTAYYGAGFAGFFFPGSFSNSIIVNNSTTGNGWNISGAGIFCQHSNFAITNCTISENSSEDAGGGLHCGNADAEIVNTIIWGNTPSEISNFGGSIIQIVFSNILGGWEGEGNIDIDPLFRDPENGDFHLMATYCGDPYDSPCIDMGHPDILDSLLDCDWGLGELRSDMGAYGGGDSIPVGIEDRDFQIPIKFALLRSYPNPFNLTTTITFSITKPQFVTLNVYDMLGRRAQTLVSEQKQPGTHVVNFDVSQLSSGIYFYRLQAGDFIESRKMLLLK